MSQVAAPGQRSAGEASRVGLRVPSLALLDAYAAARATVSAEWKRVTADAETLEVQNAVKES